MHSRRESLGGGEPLRPLWLEGVLFLRRVALALAERLCRGTLSITRLSHATGSRTVPAERFHQPSVPSPGDWGKVCVRDGSEQRKTHGVQAGKGALEEERWASCGSVLEGVSAMNEQYQNGTDWI